MPLITHLYSIIVAGNHFPISYSLINFQTTYTLQHKPIKPPIHNQLVSDFVQKLALFL